MSDKRPVENAVLVDRFWHNYFSILEKSRIHKTTAPWYRKHVEAYIKAHPGRRLSSRLSAQIVDYLNAKGRMPALPEWQFLQIADVLRLLFCECVRTDWAMAYDWYQWRAFARQLEPDHPTLIRDANPSLLVAPSSNPLIERFRNTCADCRSICQNDPCARDGGTHGTDLRALDNPLLEVSQMETPTARSNWRMRCSRR